MKDLKKYKTVKEVLNKGQFYVNGGVMIAMFSSIALPFISFSIFPKEMVGVAIKVEKLKGNTMLGH